MTVSSSLIAMVLAAGSVSLDVEPGTVCVAAPSLAQRLEKAGWRVAPEAAYRVHVQRDGSRLEVRGRKNGRELQRAFEVRLESCASAEQLVATLVIAWSEELSAPARVVVAPPPPPSPVAPEPEAPAKDPEPPVVVEVVPEPARRVLRPAGAPGSPETAPAEHSDWFRSSFKADVALLGGLNSGSTAAIAFAGQVEVSAQLQGFGLLLDGGLETGRQPPAVVPVVSTQQWLSLSALAVFSPGERVDIQVSLGFRLWRLTAQADRVYNSHEVAFAAPGGVASVGASVSLGGAFRAHVRGYFGFRGRTESFALVNYGTVMTLLPFQGGVLVGLDWRVL